MSTRKVELSGWIIDITYPRSGVDSCGVQTYFVPYPKDKEAFFRAMEQHGPIGFCSGDYEDMDDTGVMSLTFYTDLPLEEVIAWVSDCYDKHIYHYTNLEYVRRIKAGLEKDDNEYL